MNIAVFCSGNGTNLQAIIDAQKRGEIKANIAVVISDNPDAYALVRAKNAGVNTVVVKGKDFKSRQEFENRIIGELDNNKVDLIVLAGFMRMLSPAFIKKYKNRILNIHPALLPSFKGTTAIKDAFDYGVKVTGPTVHFVDEEVDHGPIILQQAVEVKETDTQETLEEKIHKQEHAIYPAAIKLFIEGKLKVEGRKVRILQCVIALLVCSFSIMTANALTTENMTPHLANIGMITKQPIQNKTDQMPQIKQRQLSLPEESQNLPEIDAAKPTKMQNIQDGIWSTQEVQRSSKVNIFKSNDALDAYFRNLGNRSERLSKDDLSERKLRLAQEAIEQTSEMAEALNLAPVVGVIEVGKKVIDLRQTLKKKYNLHINIDTKKALISYRKKF